MGQDFESAAKPALPRTIDANTDARRPTLHLIKRRTETAREQAPEVDAEDVVDQASYDSFPASDPPSFSPTRIGPATADDRRKPDKKRSGAS